MKDILIEYGVNIAVYLIVTLIGVFGAWISSKIAKKLELANIKAATENVVSATQTTVLELQQTVVDDLKAAAGDGKLTETEIKELGVKLLDMTVSKLSEPVRKLLESAKVDLTALIKSTAEAYIKNMKGYWE